jgi:tetratricopeptide (TPR) repeat protein
MDYPEYLRLTQQAEQLAQASRLQEAVDAYYKLILSDISDIDKASLCVQMAMVYDRMGNSDEALEWFDKGIENEKTYFRFDVSEKKAQFLSQIGRNTEAAAIYEELIKQPFVSEADKERMRKLIQSMLSKSLRGWK